MILHVDANSFYASCERLFRPDLRNRPVVVLSNNDGIIIALTQEAKDMGLKRGDAYFKVKDFCKSHGVEAFSSNYTLYADMSFRLNSIYSLFAERCEIYSIDESFLYLPDLVNLEYTKFARFLKKLVWQQTGIPVSVGIAPTKTLAKLCNKMAKKHGGVFNWNECDREQTLKDYKVEDIWNIGRAKSAWLRQNGVMNAFSLAHFPLDRAKKHLTITGVNTILELNGKEAVFFVERIRSKNICSSRSFQKAVTNLAELKRAMTYFCSIAVQKLREEKQCCKSIYVTLATAAPFDTDFDPEIHYFNGAGVRLPSPTSYLPAIVQNAEKLLESIYRPCYGYRKASVNLLELVEEDRSPCLFETEVEVQEKKYGRIMDCLMQVSDSYGKDSLIMAGRASSRPDENWQLKRDLKSPHYTTDLSDLPEAT